MKHHTYTLLAIALAVLYANAFAAEGIQQVFFYRPTVPHVEPPPLVRFSGTLHSPKEKKESGVRTLTIRVGKAEWKLWLTDVQTLTGSNRGWMILRDISPRRLSLSGPDKLLRPLERPEMAGKAVTIEGRLYIGTRKLVVTTTGESE